jgi:hypothetical protein
MTYKSAEIRWFSEKAEELWAIYEKLPPKGEGIAEAPRTDHYLKTGLEHTGIKIREGNHEIKVKSGEDEATPYGPLEQWVKWSYPEEQNILNSIGKEFLNEWMAVGKARYKKTYRILGPGRLAYSDSGWVEEGCGVEFTELFLPDQDRRFYTLGFEAFGTHHSPSRNLLAALESLKPDVDLLQQKGCMSYPVWLKRWG